MTAPRASLRRTVGSLYGLHIAGYVLPLIAFPYLTRVLEPAGFGAYAFAVLLGRFGLMITDFGFAYSATRSIARLRDRGAPVEGTYAAVVAARLGIVVLCAAALAVLQLTVPRFGEAGAASWVVLAGVLGSALVPTWLFQAFERLPAVAAVNLVARTVSTALTFVLVRGPGDIVAAAWLWSIPWLLSGALTMLLARRMLGVGLVRPRASAVRAVTADGAHIFVSLAAASLYTTANGLILGLMRDDVQLGYYTAAEGIVIAASGLIVPFSQAVYPRSVLAHDRGEDAWRANTARLLRYLGGLGVALTLVCTLGAPLIQRFVLGPDYGASVDILRLLGPIPLAIAVATVLSVHTLFPMGRDRDFSRLVVGVGVANVAVSALLTHAWGGPGTAAAALASEAAIAIALWLMVMRPPRARSGGPEDGGDLVALP